MKVRLMRIVKDRITKEDIEIPAEIDDSEVQCVYKDQNGVVLSLASGYVIKVSHTFEEMVSCFIGSNELQ